MKPRRQVLSHERPICKCSIFFQQLVIGFSPSAQTILDQPLCYKTYVQSQIKIKRNGWLLVEWDSEIVGEAIGVGHTDSDQPKVWYLNIIPSGVASLTIISVKIREVDMRYIRLNNS